MSILTEPRANGAPRLDQALGRVVDAAQHVATDQLGLVRIEVEAALQKFALTGAMLFGGGALLVVAWVALMSAAFTVLVPMTGDGLAFLAIAALNLMIGAWLMERGIEATRGTHGST